jgi:ATP-binding cassette subfamily B protein/subfamily B ATP-binding cassette protein MsbA
VRIFRTLLGYARPYLATFAFSLALVGMITGLELLKPWPVKLAFDQIIDGQPLRLLGREIPWATLSTAAQIALAAGLYVFAHFAVGFIQLLNNFVTIRIGQDLVQDLRVQLFEHLQRQRLLFHQTQPTGDLIYRIMGDCYAVQALLMNGVFTTLTSSAFLVGMFVILLQLDVELTLYALCITPLLFLAIGRVGKIIGALSWETNTLESKLYSRVERIFSSISLVQAFAREEEEKARFADDSRHTFRRKLKLFSYQTFFGWAVGALTALGSALVLYVGVRHVVEGTLTKGELTVFLAYLASLYTPLSQLSQITADIRTSAARIKRVFEILDQDQAMPEKPDARPLAVTRGEVRYEGVSFGYTPGVPVLRDVSFTAPGGGMVAVVGKTGSGKTSLMGLLLRFFDPQEGRIRIDGQDLRDLKLKSLRQQIAVVLQETTLFPMSVKDNIAYGRTNASDEDIRAAASAAGAHEFIAALPQGYDTLLDERGSNLSGGQRQRLSIARALLKDAPILILDEPTSAVDAETEASIMDGLHRLMRHRTTFVIAHRLSMMKRADLILVIKEGRLLESGTFAQLMARNGEFARLHALQQKTDTGGPEAVPDLAPAGAAS